MHRIDDSNYFLFIKPQKPKEQYIDDEITKFIKKVLSDYVISSLYKNLDADQLEDQYNKKLI